MVPEDLLGSWRLESFERFPDAGERVLPLGARPDGLLSYTPDGMMSVHLVADEGEAEVEMPAYTGYFGGFGVDREKGVVRHQIEAASAPGLAGTVQERHYQLSGDRLELNARFGGSAFRLVWKR